MLSIEAMVAIAQLVHIVYMDDNQRPAAVMYSESASATRLHGSQKKCYSVCLQDTIRKYNLSCDSWETAEHDHTKWVLLYCEGMKSLLIRRIKKANIKRQVRKTRTTNSHLENTLLNFRCDYCDQTSRQRVDRWMDDWGFMALSTT